MKNLTLEKLGRSKWMRIFDKGLGLAEKRDYIKAEQTFRRALPHAKKLRTPEPLFHTLIALAESVLGQKRIAEAKEIAERAFEVAGMRIGEESPSAVMAAGTMARILLEEKEASEAISMYEAAAYVLISKRNDAEFRQCLPDLLVQIFMPLAACYIEFDRLEFAERFIQHAVDLATHNGEVDCTVNVLAIYLRSLIRRRKRGQNWDSSTTPHAFLGHAVGPTMNLPV